jgi:hypothetical protein
MKVSDDDKAVAAPPSDIQTRATSHQAGHQAGIMPAQNVNGSGRDKVL